jgi:hypothetical protein
MDTKTDTVVLRDGMNALLEKLGSVDAERFISLIIKEPFDYTKWQEEALRFKGLSVRELSKKAMEQYNQPRP